MARVIRPLRKCLQFCCCCSSSSHKPLISRALRQNPITFPPENPYVLKTLRHYISEMRRSAFEGTILRLLRNEIGYELERSPPNQFFDYCIIAPPMDGVVVEGLGFGGVLPSKFQPVKKFGAFTIDERPGEQWIRLEREYGEDENIKIEVTMFDQAIPAPKAGGSSTGEDVLLHITTIVNITKGDGSEILEIMCSAWPDSLEIDKLFIRRGEKMPAQPYSGPEFKELDDDFQNSLYDYLEARGVDDQLAVFLHKYMKNKDKTEFIRWMETVKSFIEIN